MKDRILNKILEFLTFLLIVSAHVGCCVLIGGKYFKNFPLIYFSIIIVLFIIWFLLMCFNLNNIVDYIVLKEDTKNERNN